VNDVAGVLNRVLGDEDSDTLDSMNKLAEVYRCQCKFAQAESHSGSLGGVVDGEIHAHLGGPSEEGCRNSRRSPTLRIVPFGADGARVFPAPRNFSR
jgi:hypothetical protein